MSQDPPTEVLGGAALPTPGDPQTLAPGQGFGPYTIEEAIGRGGMGEVYRARQQTPVNRIVALKLLQQRLRGTLAETLFQVESQALARLRHPSIAQVYDAGSLGGQPFLAMEWVAGQPMSEWITERRPDRRQRLALLAEVARGAHHAHVNGILHRDLKPDNVMVVSEQGRDQPKIIDFGVAVAWLAERHDQVAPRSLAERVGTPTYMSPEQRAGRADLDPRSDVYSLGVMLLQMLLGDELEPWPTLDSRRCAALLHGSWALADDEDNLQLQVRLRALPVELRWLLGRALSDDREHRYESALNLALDLERYLAQRPLEAAPAGRLYPLRKFLQRNRLPVALASLAIVALLLGLAVALYGLRQARSERANAIMAAEQARVAAARAERISDFVRSILSAVDPDVAREMDKTLLRKVLDEAAARAQAELADDPAVLGNIEAVIGRTYRNLGEPARALPLLERAREQGELRSVADMRTLSMAYDDLGRTDEAMMTLEAFRAQLLPEQGEHGDDVLQLEAERLEYLLRAGDPAPVISAAENLLPLLEARLGPRHRSSLRLLNTLARAEMRAGRDAVALQRMHTLIERRLASDGPDHPQTIRDQAALVMALLGARRYDEALPLAEQQAVVTRRIYGPSHPATLSVDSFLGSALKGLGRYDEAASAFARSYEGFRAVFGATHPNVVGTGFNLASTQLLAGQAKVAEQHLLELSEQAPAAFGEQHPMLADIELALLRSRLAQGHLAGVEVALLRLYEAASQPAAPTAVLLADLRLALRDYYQRSHQPQQAARYGDPAAD